MYIWRPEEKLRVAVTVRVFQPETLLHRNSKIWRSINTAPFTAKTLGSLCVLQPDIASSWKNLIRDVKWPQLPDSARSVAVAAVPCRVPATGSSASDPAACRVPPEQRVLDQLFTRPPSLPCIAPLLCNPKYYSLSRQACMIADNSEITLSIPFFRSLALYSGGYIGSWIWYPISLQRSDQHLHAVCTLLICFQREDKTPNYA